MKTKLAILGLCLTIAFPLLAQKKEDERLTNSATVMQELLQGDKVSRRISSIRPCVSSCFRASRKLQLVSAEATGAA